MYDTQQNRMIAIHKYNTSDDNNNSTKYKYFYQDNNRNNTY
jgi:hypothetical protein